MPLATIEYKTAAEIENTTNVSSAVVQVSRLVILSFTSSPNE